MELFSHPFLKVNQVEDKFNSLMIALEIMLDFKTRSMLPNYSMLCKKL